MKTGLESTNEALKILEKSNAGERISKEEALILYKEADFLDIQKVARQKRESTLSHRYASYTMFRVVNYTNYCNVECSFCSFMDEIGNGKGYNLTKEEILEKMNFPIVFSDKFQQSDIALLKKILRVNPTNRPDIY